MNKTALAFAMAIVALASVSIAMMSEEDSATGYEVGDICTLYIQTEGCDGVGSGTYDLSYSDSSIFEFISAKWNVDAALKEAGMTRGVFAVSPATSISGGDIATIELKCVKAGSCEISGTILYKGAKGIDLKTETIDTIKVEVSGPVNNTIVVDYICDGMKIKDSTVKEVGEKVDFSPELEVDGYELLESVDIYGAGDSEIVMEFHYRAVSLAKNLSVMLSQDGRFAEVLIAGDGLVPGGEVDLKLAYAKYESDLGFCVSGYEHVRFSIDKSETTYSLERIDLSKCQNYDAIFSMSAEFIPDVGEKVSSSKVAFEPGQTGGPLSSLFQSNSGSKEAILDITYYCKDASISPMDAIWAPSLGKLSFSGVVGVEGYRFVAATLSGTIPGDLELRLGYDPLSVSETINIALQMHVPGMEPIDMDLAPYPVSVADGDAFVSALINGTALSGMICEMDGYTVVSIDGIVAKDGYDYAVFYQVGSGWELYRGGHGTVFTVVYDKVFSEEEYKVLPPRQKATYTYDETSGYAYRIPDSKVSDYVYNIYLQLHDPIIKRQDLVMWLEPYYTDEQGRYVFASALTSGLDAAGITYSISKSGTIGMIGGYTPREGSDGTYGFTIYRFDGTGYVVAESTEPDTTYMIVFDRVLSEKEFDALSPDDKVDYHSMDPITVLPHCFVGCTSDYGVFVGQEGSSVTVRVIGDTYVPSGTVTLRMAVSQYDPLIGSLTVYYEYLTVYVEGDGSGSLGCSVDIGDEPYYQSVFKVSALYVSEVEISEKASSKMVYIPL